MIMESDLLALVEEILEVAPGTVGLSDDLVDLGWDSLAVLNLISIADERYGAQLDEHALADAGTPADLLALFPVAA